LIRNTDGQNDDPKNGSEERVETRNSKVKDNGFNDKRRKATSESDAKDESDEDHKQLVIPKDVPCFQSGDNVSTFLNQFESDMPSLLD